jgi:cytochrome c-type biogenesis protein CcmF
VIRLLGYSATVFALGLAVYGAIAAFWGVRSRRPEILASVRTATYAAFGLILMANLAMIYGLVTHDFSISYVAQVGSRATPFWIGVISLWSALEGSILLWGLVLAGCAAAVAWLHRDEKSDMFAVTNGMMMVVSAFFYMLMVGPANPFGLVSPVPADGPGPNPLLQNHWLMAVHPPLLYLGYVGLTVPFAFAIGALLSGRLDDTWLRVTRRWTVLAWMFLTLAIIAGMWWSYEVLGWGGYWAWDPVENASFLPWLTATAFVHSVMVQERRGMLRMWTLSLIIATFLLTILGTFLTRSGIVASVHAFTQGTIGYWFLGFMAVVLVFSMVLLAGRSRELESEGRLDHPVSRESAFLFNNLLFVAFTFTVLLGTLFPVLAEAVRGVRVSVGEPFFNRMTLPICMALIFLMGVGPALPWRRASPGQLKRQFVPPLAAMALVIAAALALGARNVYAILAFAFAAFALTVNVRQFTDAAGVRMRAHGEGALQALTRAVNANRRRYGGYLAHIGVITMVVGIAASSAFTTRVDRTVAPGEAFQVRGYELRFDRLWAQEEPQRFVVAADVSVFRDGRALGALAPRMNFYRMSDEPVVTPAVRSRPHRDLYITLMAFDRDGASATFQVFVEPLVMWIWLGGAIIAFGTFVAVWPRRQRGLPDPDRSLATTGAEEAGR